MKKVNQGGVQLTPLEKADLKARLQRLEEFLMWEPADQTNKPKNRAAIQKPKRPEYSVTVPRL